MQSIKLVKQLREHTSMSVDEIASLLGVSARTARAYIHDTNASLADVATITFARRRAGYVLEVSDEAGLTAWLERMQALETSDASSSEQARVSYLMNDLLSRGDWVTIADLASVLYVTPQRISSDLKVVERNLKRFGLGIEKRPRYGIRVTGDELSRRLCLADIASRTQLASVLGADTQTSLELLHRVTDRLQEVLEEEGFSMGRLSFQNLVVHVYVALVRIRANCYVPMETKHFERVRQTPEYAVAEKVARAVEQEANVELPEAEVAYIAIHLAGKRTLNSLIFTGDENEEAEDDSAAISDDVWNVVSQILDVVEDQFKFDFRGDLELRMNLARHLVPLSVRLTYHMQVDNPILDDIKARFPMAFSMAIESGKILEQAWGAYPSEEEMGYIAMAFALAIERQRTEMPKKNILVVCASGQGSARLLEMRYRREFGDLIDTCSACDVASIGEIDFSNIDYVFTTVPLPRAVPVPVREVTYFLDSSEASHIKQILGGARDAAGFFRELDEELFFTHLSFPTKQAVIDYLCDRVEEKRPVDADFREKIARREAAAATSFGNLVAMPHPIEAVCDETFACIGLLDTPVVWDDRGTKVQAVFLVFFPRKGGIDRGDFFGKLADLFMNEGAMKRVVDNQDWQTFLSEFEGGR